MGSKDKAEQKETGREDKMQKKIPTYKVVSCEIQSIQSVMLFF